MMTYINTDTGFKIILCAVVGLAFGLIDQNIGPPPETFELVSNGLIALLLIFIGFAGTRNDENTNEIVIGFLKYGAVFLFLYIVVTPLLILALRA